MLASFAGGVASTALSATAAVIGGVLAGAAGAWATRKAAGWRRPSPSLAVWPCIALAAFSLGSVAVAIRGGVKPAGSALGSHGSKAAHAAAFRNARLIRDPTDAGPFGIARQRARTALDPGLPHDVSALLQGMALGDDSGLSSSVKESFRRASLTHVTAASGQNIVFLFVLLLPLLALLGAPARVRFAVCAAVAAAYVPFAGGESPIRRACAMALVALIARRRGSRGGVWHSLIAAGAITTLVDPSAPFELGWQLSFSAVAAMVAVGGRLQVRLERTGLPALAAEPLAATVAATVATSPLIAHSVGRLSLTAIPANVVASPAVAVSMLLALAASAVAQVSTELAQPLAWAGAVPAAAVIEVASVFAAPTWASVAWRPNAVETIAALAAGCLLCLLPLPAAPLFGRHNLDGQGLGSAPGRHRARGLRRWLRFRSSRRTSEGEPGQRQRLRLPRVRSGAPSRRLPPGALSLACAALVVGAFGSAVVGGRLDCGEGALLRGLAARTLGCRPDRQPEQGPRIAFIDVGQGDAEVVADGQRGILVDTGPPGTPIAAKLRRLGVDSLAAVLLTHGQADHAGALDDLLAGMRPDLVIDGTKTAPGAETARVRALITESGIRAVVPKPGLTVRVGSASIELLSPETPTMPGDDPNGASAVAVGRARGVTALLTADSESPTLSALPLGHVDVLKLAHHGSSDPGLGSVLAATTPRLTVIEVGRNPYGHPAAQPVREAGLWGPVLRTDWGGAVTVRSRAGGRIEVGRVDTG